MTTSKKDRLSLSKKRKLKDGPASTPTILSMFKKQKEKQTVSIEDVDTVTVDESGSEPDVVITKVIKSSSGTVMSQVEYDGDLLTRRKSQENVEHTAQGTSLETKRSKFRNSSSESGNRKDYGNKDEKVSRQNSKQSKDARGLGEKTNNRSDIKIYDLQEESEEKTVNDIDNTDLNEKTNTKKDNTKSTETRTSSRLKSRSLSAEPDVHIIEKNPRLSSSKKRKLTLKKSLTDSEVNKKKKLCTEQTDREQFEERIQVVEENETLADISDAMDKEHGQSKMENAEKGKTDENLCEAKQIDNKALNSSEQKTETVKSAKYKDKSEGIDAKKTKVECDKEDICGSISESVEGGKQSPEIGKNIIGNKVDKFSKPETIYAKDVNKNHTEVPSPQVEDKDGVEGEPTEETEYQVPYYLENFHTIIDSVLGDTEYCRLFNASDMQYITAFREMSESCQKLYVRIFGRKLSWLTMVKLKYPGISDDIPSLVDQLIATGFLMSGENLEDLPVLLKLLPAPDLKSLAKTFHINTTNTTKPKLVELLMKKSQQSSIGSMFAGGSSASTLKTMIKRAKGYVGKVCRLHEDVRAVFIRLLMLFCLYNTNFDEDNGSVGQNQLFQMLMVNIGKVTYPSYTVNKQKPVFKDREAVVRFETALQFEMDLLHLIDRSKWDDAYVVYEKARVVGESILKNKHYRKWDGDLPEFLRLYTAGCIYIRIANQGVEILQRKKKYSEAVSLLEEMLAQKLYCNQYRGHWYERLALNLDAHLKKPALSLDVIKRGLSDEHVRSGRKLAIYERAKKLCETPKSKFTERMKEFLHDPVTPPPETTIEGMVISDATSMGMKYQFVMQGDSNSTTFCAVEELVLDHYKNNGYPSGLHAEGSIIANLFTLYFWDILYMDIKDVFQGPFQSCPLDLYTRDFYKQRQGAVDLRLNWIKNATEQELTDEIRKVWDEHSGKMCIGLSWERFTGPETHQGLVSCMNGAMIAGVLERYVKDPRHTRSGFPDLTLWNTETKTIKISEVKGPNDRLSYKQILWIDYLLKLGIDAEVCYVKAVGSKKIKPKATK